ncbi:MAG: TolC family protein [Alphaproteobacteria bacterium]|nr:TolC family protein [Alphaproteobacteria bacterium]
MRKFIYLLCSILFVSNAFGIVLSFNDVIEKIVAESNDVKKAEANIKKAQAQLKSVSANRWLSVDGSASYMNLIDVEHPFDSEGVRIPAEIGAMLEHAQQGDFTIPDNIFSVGVNATQPIYTFGKIGHALDAMQMAIDMSKSAKELTLREVKYAAADLYWTAKMTDEIVKASEKTLKDARKAKQNLVSTGRANRMNLVKIESDIATKEVNVSDAKFNRDTAYRMLKIMVGLAPDTDIVLQDEIPNEFEKQDFKTLTSTPQWDIYEKQIKMYESNAASKRAGAYPSLAAMGSYSLYSMGQDMGHLFDKKSSQSAYLGLALQVPLFSAGLHSANATIEAMNAEAVHQDLDKSKKLKTEEYNTAVKKYSHLCDNLSKLKNAKELAQKTYTLSVNRFANGQTSAVELSDVSSALYQMDVALINTKYNILMSVETVKKLGE